VVREGEGFRSRQRPPVAMIVSIIALCLVATLTCLSFVAAPLAQTAGKRVSHLADWESFYQSDVSHYFKLPAAATIVSAEELLPFPMGREVTIRFRLPGSKTSGRWVKEIANASGIDDSHRKTPLLYDGAGDLNIVRYEPASGLYEVLYGWD
jgi:hypothetical protein